MFKQTATDLTTVSPALFDEWINSFDTVLFDCDGVLWIGPKLIDGSVETVNRLQELGKKVYFVTNSTGRTRTELQQDATKRGYNITENQILSASYATAKYLYDLNFNKKVYLVGRDAVLKELNAFGIQCIQSEQHTIERSLYEMVFNGVNLDNDVGAVVVSFDAKFTYSKLLDASNYAKKPDCLFLATSLDERYPTKDGIGTIPLVAPLVQAVETASERSATLVGKPSSIMYQTLLQYGHIDPARTLMVGDSVKSDILFGFNNGIHTLFVGSGLNSIDEVKVWQNSNNAEDKKLIPDVYLPKVGDLLPLLK